MGKRSKEKKSKPRITTSVDVERTPKQYISGWVFWSVSTILLVAYIVSGILYAKGICETFIPTGVISIGTMILFILLTPKMNFDKEEHRLFWSFSIMMFIFLSSLWFAASNHDSSQNTIDKDYNRGLIEGILIGSSLK